MPDGGRVLKDRTDNCGVKADWKRWNFRWRLKVDRVSIERMSVGREFQVEGADTEKAREEKLLVIPGAWSGKEISIGRTQVLACVQILNTAFTRLNNSHGSLVQNGQKNLFIPSLEAIYRDHFLPTMFKS